VAGIAALVKSANFSLSPIEVRKIIEKTAEPLGLNEEALPTSPTFQGSPSPGPERQAVMVADTPTLRNTARHGPVCDLPAISPVGRVKWEETEAE
jgi:hypothetical protein